MFYTGVLRTLIISAFLLLAVKTVDMVIIASVPDSDGILVAESQAKSEPAKKEEKKEAPKKESGHGEAKAEEKKEDGGHGESSGGGHGEKAAEKPANISEERPISVDEVRTFTDSEIEVLKRLSERRERLLKWEKDLQIKENVLKITEEKIDNKLEELRALKKQVETSLAEYRKQEDAKTLSLVKIYENMKPKNAADILAKMRVDDALPIIDRMKEKNAADILAKMDPKIAKEITTKLNRIGQLK